MLQLTNSKKKFLYCYLIVGFLLPFLHSGLLYNILNSLILGISLLFIVDSIIFSQSALKNRNIRVIHLLVLLSILTTLVNSKVMLPQNLSMIIVLVNSLYVIFNTDFDLESDIIFVLTTLRIVVSMTLLVLLANIITTQTSASLPISMSIDQMVIMVVIAISSLVTHELLVRNYELKKSTYSTLFTPIVLVILALAILLLNQSRLTHLFIFCTLVFVIIQVYSVTIEKTKKHSTILVSISFALIFSILSIFLMLSLYGDSIHSISKMFSEGTYLQRLFGYGVSKDKPLQGNLYLLQTIGIIGTSVFLIIIYKLIKPLIIGMYRNIRSNSNLVIVQRILFSTLLFVFISQVTLGNMTFGTVNFITFYTWWTLGITISIDTKLIKETFKEETKNVAFVAWTPLHLINIVNIRSDRYQNDKSYLYIYDNFLNASVYADLIRENQYFENVYLVNPNEAGSGLLRKFNSIMNRNSYDVDISPCTFDIMFTQGGNQFQKTLFGYHKYKNNYIELNYLEDGMITYVAKSLSDIFNTGAINMKLMNFINPYSIHNQKIEVGYMYEPKLFFEKDLFLNVSKLRPLNSPGRTTMFELVNVFNLVDTENRKKYDDKIIFLDQPFLDAEYEIDEVEFYKTMHQFYESEILVKMHPRSTREGEYGPTILEEVIPWELLQLRYDFTKTKVVSMSSTAPFTSVLMFDASVSQVSVIFAIDVIINEYKEKSPKVFHEISEFAHKFAKEYPNIIIPKSMVELGDILKSKE